MKNMKLILVVLILVLIVIGIIYTNIIPYPTGKDTVKSFANGRFQTIRLVTTDASGEMREKVTLYEYGKDTIESNIYHEKSVDDIEYFLGIDGYTVLDYKNCKYKHSDNIEDFTEREKEIFEEFKYEKYNYGHPNY